MVVGGRTRFCNFQMNYFNFHVNSSLIKNVTTRTKSGISCENSMLFWLEVFPRAIRSILIGEWISYPDLVYLSSVVKSSKAKENLTVLVRQYCKEINAARLVSIAEAKWVSSELGVSMKCQSVDINVLSNSASIHHLTLANVSLFSNAH